MNSSPHCTFFLFSRSAVAVLQETLYKHLLGERMRRCGDNLADYWNQVNSTSRNWSFLDIPSWCPIGPCRPLEMSCPFTISSIRCAFPHQQSVSTVADSKLVPQGEVTIAHAHGRSLGGHGPIRQNGYLPPTVAIEIFLSHYSLQSAFILFFFPFSLPFWCFVHSAYCL